MSAVGRVEDREEGAKEAIDRQLIERRGQGPRVCDNTARLPPKLSFTPFLKSCL